MSMVDPNRQPLTGVELVNWLHDQVSALKAQLGRMQQQNEQARDDVAHPAIASCAASNVNLGAHRLATAMLAASRPTAPIPV